MNKIAILCAGLALSFATHLWAGEDSVPDELRSRLAVLTPEMAPDSISPAPIKGFFEVIYGAQVVYVSEDGKYLLSGSLFDLDTRENLTDQSRSRARKAVLDGINEEDMIVYAPKNPKHTITVFTDVDCPYCQKLHSEMNQYTDLGIKVRYLMFPRTRVGSPGFNKAVSVWCSDDRNKAMDLAKSQQSVESKKCDNPVQDQMLIGQEMGVTGTPAIVLEDGELLPGYRPAKDIAMLLEHMTQVSSSATRATFTEGAGAKE